MTSIMDILNIPFGYLLRFCNWIGFGNYALALLFFAVIVKIILFPLGIRQQKNMVKQASLRPKEMAIRKRYDGRTDRVTMQKMQTEIQELYQRENFSPFGGCLPLLLQFPIIIALYNVIRNPLTYLLRIGSENLQAIKDIYMNMTGSSAVQYDLQMLNHIKENFGSYADHFNGMTVQDLPNFEIIPGFDLSVNPAFWNWMLVVVVLCYVTSFLSMRLSRKFSYQAPQTGDAAKSMLIMDFVMPLMSAWIAFSLPAVIGVYWIYQNILAVAQQFILSRMFPYPTFTEEEMKAIEKEMNGNIRKQKKKKPTSLHHIDDEDDDTAVPAPQKKEKIADADAPVLKEDKNGKKPEKKTEETTKRSLHHIDD